MRTASRSNHRSCTLSEYAAQMRHSPTLSEARLFEAVRGGKLGVACRRQAPLLGRYIGDLCAPAVRLVIEVDGAYQPRASRRAAGPCVLVRAGYRVLRLDIELIMNDCDAAVACVREAIAAS
jgi:very-short-patch-repair endonuclease